MRRSFVIRAVNILLKIIYLRNITQRGQLHSISNTVKLGSSIVKLKYPTKHPTKNNLLTKYNTA